MRQADSRGSWVLVGEVDMGQQANKMIVSENTRRIKQASGREVREASLEEVPRAGVEPRQDWAGRSAQTTEEEKLSVGRPGRR